MKNLLLLLFSLALIPLLGAQERDVHFFSLQNHSKTVIELVKMHSKRESADDDFQDIQIPTKPADISDATPGNVSLITKRKKKKILIDFDQLEDEVIKGKTPLPTQIGTKSVAVAAYNPLENNKSGEHNRQTLSAKKSPMIASPYAPKKYGVSGPKRNNGNGKSPV